MVLVVVQKTLHCFLLQQQHHPPTAAATTTTTVLKTTPVPPGVRSHRHWDRMSRCRANISKEAKEVDRVSARERMWRRRSTITSTTTTTASTPASVTRFATTAVAPSAAKSVLRYCNDDDDGTGSNNSWNTRMHSNNNNNTFNNKNNNRCWNLHAHAQIPNHQTPPATIHSTPTNDPLFLQSIMLLQTLQKRRQCNLHFLWTNSRSLRSCSLCKYGVYGTCTHSEGKEGHGSAVICFCCRPDRTIAQQLNSSTFNSSHSFQLQYNIIIYSVINL